MTDDEAHAVVTTASRLGHEGSLPVLKRFRAHTSLDVRRQLVGTWRRFDAQEYADEVLAHVGREGLDLTVTSEEQVRALWTMRPWRRVDLNGEYPLDAFMGALDPDAQNLTLRSNPHIQDLRALHALPSLSFLSLMYCPEVRDLAPLAETRLRHLSVIDLPALPTLTGLSRVTSLTSLSVIQPIPGDSLAAYLPVGAPLDQLVLGRGATETTGLTGLDAFPGLTRLNLSSDAAALGPRDWEQLARHPALTRLSLGGRLLPPHGPTTELAGIRVLSLHLEAGTEEHVSRLAPAVPYAHDVHLYFAEDAAPATDDVYAGLFPQAEVAVHRWGH
ncbi:leucine-rich repeat domain-containing protein [Streptomyces sp. NPDC055134]